MGIVQISLDRAEWVSTEAAVESQRTVSAGGVAAGTPLPDARRTGTNGWA